MEDWPLVTATCEYTPVSDNMATSRVEVERTINEITEHRTRSGTADGNIQKVGVALKYLLKEQEQNTMD